MRDAAPTLTDWASILDPTVATSASLCVLRGQAAAAVAAVLEKALLSTTRKVGKRRRARRCLPHHDQAHADTTSAETAQVAKSSETVHLKNNDKDYRGVTSASLTTSADDVLNRSISELELITVAVRPLGKGVFAPRSLIALATASDISTILTSRGANGGRGAVGALCRNRTGIAIPGAAPSMQRIPLGFVSSGGYAWSNGHGLAVGHCHLGRLRWLLNRDHSTDHDQQVAAVR
eukprot:SAG31_NODE_3720_length_3951_cov_2.268172_1_plen_234_part_00